VRLSRGIRYGETNLCIERGRDGVLACQLSPTCTLYVCSARPLTGMLMHEGSELPIRQECSMALASFRLLYCFVSLADTTHAQICFLPATRFFSKTSKKFSLNLEYKPLNKISHYTFIDIETISIILKARVKF
jgi:hypothetical protein